MEERLGKRVSKNIKRFRQVAGLTQEGLAERMGVTVRYVSALEQNPGNLNLRTLQRVANALKVDVADLLADPAAARDVRVAAAEKAIDILREYIRSQR
jgi:transcriptional regulator with XRE-family HTH domain